MLDVGNRNCHRHKMRYLILDAGSNPLKAAIEIRQGALSLLSAGGSKDGSPRNPDYDRALPLIIARLRRAKLVVCSEWVARTRTASLPAESRTISRAIDRGLAANQVSAAWKARMRAIGRAPRATGPGNAQKRIEIALTSNASVEAIMAALMATPLEERSSRSQLLPAGQLALVRPEHIWQAVQDLRFTEDRFGFGESVDYDIVLEDNTRLPPKAVFGRALFLALGIEVRPEHFSSGVNSHCFRALEASGFTIANKAGKVTRATRNNGQTTSPDDEWREGGRKLQKHLERERQPALRAAKLAQFKETHGGRLFCERCGEDPSTKYSSHLAEACIEVHHCRVQVKDMRAGHLTKLDDLLCLCANCHRVEHRRLRLASRAEVVAQVPSPIRHGDHGPPPLLSAPT